MTIIYFVRPPASPNESAWPSRWRFPVRVSLAAIDIWRSSKSKRAQSRKSAAATTERKRATEFATQNVSGAPKFVGKSLM
jgi:hypothetical protein